MVRKKRRIVFDLESDGLLREATVIWCIVCKDIDTGELYKFTPGSIDQGVSFLQGNIIIGHNICGFDVPLIERLTGVVLDIKDCRDTLVMSKLFYPAQRLHSLEFYGEKFKRAKPVHEDWSQFSEAMLHRCTEDVEINALVYEDFLRKEISKWDWSQSIITEQFFAYDQSQQELAGVTIDVELAYEVLDKLDKEVGEIEKTLRRFLPPRVVNKKPVNKPFKQDGTYSKMFLDWFPEEENHTQGPTVCGPFTRIVYEPINLNSDQQVKKYLLSVGWEPTTWNYKKDEKGFFAKDAKGKKIKTSPKLTEDSYPSIKDEMGQLIARRNILVHRRRTISNYKDPENKGILSYIRDDGRVPAVGILCATPTARTAHREAVCNIPKAKKKIPYGIEMRSLFCVKNPLYIMLGADLDQIEARVTAHFASLFDGGDYWRVLSEIGDIHQYNADLLGVDRDPTAKAFQYATFFGARAGKIAEIVKCSVKKAQGYIDTFWEGNKGVYDLVQALEREHKEYGYIKGLDGRKLLIRAKYKLLNSLIQSAAAIIFKTWGILANRNLRAEGLDCKQIMAVHDEFSYRCLIAHQSRASEIIAKAATEAGEFYNLYTPITADVKAGRNWAEVH